MLRVSVHPRVCGEQCERTATASARCGSSPRVRGTGPIRLNPANRKRFIPACAGNRKYWASSAGVITVHPRVCGEQVLRTTVTLPGCGSSPRVRGTAYPGGTSSPYIRFIPACAGNRGVPLRPGQDPTVHPRVCGEQFVDLPRHNMTRGSSPRVRGTGNRPLCCCRWRRFIPACAGNRALCRPNPTVRSVHPRVCGEQFTMNKARMTGNGSSPRVRGTGLRKKR